MPTDIYINEQMSYIYIYIYIRLVYCLINNKHAIAKAQKYSKQAGMAAKCHNNKMTAPMTLLTEWKWEKIRPDGFKFAKVIKK